MVGNVFVFFVIGLVRGVATGVGCVVDTDLVRFGLGEAIVAVPLDVLPFLLLDCRGLVRPGWLRVYCLASAGVGVILVVAAASSASICSISSSVAGGVVISALPLPSPLPLPARTGMEGSSSRSSSSSS